MNESPQKFRVFCLQCDSATHTVIHVLAAPEGFQIECTKCGTTATDDEPEKYTA